MVNGKHSLHIHAVGDLLLLYWQRSTGITGELGITLDGEQLEKPILGVELPEVPAYLLVAYSKGLAVRKNFEARIVTSGSETLADACCAKSRPWPRSLIESWPLTHRIRVEKALLRTAIDLFPRLGMSTRRKIAEALLEPEAICRVGPEALLYVRVPAPASAEAGLLNATLRRLSEGGQEATSATLTGLLDAGHLHFFARLGTAQRVPSEIGILDAGPIRCAPFLMPVPSPPMAGLTVNAWIDELAGAYAGDPRVFKAFAATHAGLPVRRGHPRAGHGSVLGKVEGVRFGRVVGWAFDTGRPYESVRLRVAIDGRDAGTVEANLPRPDLEAQGYFNSGFLWRVDERCLIGGAHRISIRCAETGAELDCSPLRCGPGEFDGDFRLDDTGYLVGWVKARCRSPDSVSVAVVLDGWRCAELSASPFDPGSAVPGSDPVQGFRFPLPDRVFDSEAHTIEVEAGNGYGESRPIGRLMRVQAVYRGALDRAGPDRVAGWVVNALAPDRPVPLELLVNGVVVAAARADMFRAEQSSGRRCGFEFPVPPASAEWPSLSIDLRLAGTEARILGPATVHISYDTAIRGLSVLAERLNEGAYWRSPAGVEADEGVNRWLRTEIIAKLLAEFRRARGIPSQLGLRPAPQIKLPERARRDACVDVVVPVYRGRDEALRCINSVIEADCSAPMAMVVVIDASPDPELVAELGRLSLAHGFVLLENEVNLGFVGAVNRGMRLHPGRDVVLLNSDTVVAAGWLDRLRAAAYGAGNIGTATPFSNNATICSFPLICRENAMPSGLALAEVDSAFAHANARQSIDIPTAVGFCMYIKRDVLDEVGYFDEALWGKGYGEENDFCLRASALGWRHIVACDVFVEHTGAVSFGAERQARLRQNLARLNAIYPDYSATIQRFIARDPLALARNRAARVLLKHWAPRHFLFLMHDLGGGTEVAIQELSARLQAEGVSVLVLRSATSERWRLSRHGFPYELQYRYPQDFDALVQDLRELGVLHIHYHQIVNYPKRILELPALLDIAYDFTLHDYLAICPRINLIDESRVYCGKSQYSSDTCTRCIGINGPYPQLLRLYGELGGSVAGWRAAFGDFLKQARRVFAPSEDVARRFQRHFPGLAPRIEPHPETPYRILPRRNSANRNTVAVIGAIGPNKGYDILLACARNAAKDALPLQFLVLGYTSNDESLLQCGNVEVTGRYRQEDLPGLIARSGAGVAAFLSPWPETFCYALSEAWQNRLYPVAFDIGAIAERIREARNGRLIPLTLDPTIINRTLLEVLAANDPLPEGLAMGRTVSGILGEYYGFPTGDENGIPEASDLEPLSAGAGK